MSSITATVQPLRHDLDILFAESLGPAARSKIIADAASDAFAAADAVNAAALGRPAVHRTAVDGSATEDLARVRPDGTIIRVYDLMPAVLAGIGSLLWQHSPVVSGRYQHSHRLLADGTEIAVVASGDWTPPPLPAGVAEFSFVPTVYYGGLIEPHDGKSGESRQAPDGVYQVVAAMSANQYGQLAVIGFDFRAPFDLQPDDSAEAARALASGDLRQPVIVIRAI